MSPTVVGESGARPLRVPAPADANEVMREQLEYLIVHAESGPCGCSDCQRYLRARSVLLEIFNTPRLLRH